jgi:putative acyl-CoA dehydrogenase
MRTVRARHSLETHDVTNQPPPFENVNLYTSDVALQAAVAAAGGEIYSDRISAFGARTGSAETAEWAMQAKGSGPALADLIGGETEKWAKVIKFAGIKLE